jgi:hypothetical protein
LPQITVNLEIKKLDAEQRKAYGWVSIVEGADGEPLIDHDGHVVPVAVLEKAVHKAFAASGGRGKGGDLHERQGIIDVIEGVVVTPEKRAAEGSPFAAEGPSGWWAGFHVRDDDTWSMIKSGARPELSLRGSGSGVRLAKRAGEEAREAKVLIKHIDLDSAEWFSTVDRGASGDDKPEHRPKIVLWKRQETQMDLEELIKSLQLKKAMTPKLLEVLQKLSPEEQSVVLSALEDAKGAPAAPPAAPETTPAPVPGAPPPGPTAEELAKRADIPDDVRELLRKRAEAESREREERIELQKRVDRIENEKLSLEIAKRVEKDMPHLPGKTDEWVDMLKAIRKGVVTSEQAADFESRLVAMSKAMQQSPMLRVIGTSQEPQAGAATSEIERLAKAYLEKSPDLTLAQAKVEIIKRQPGLYKAARAEEEAAS